ncbi:MAG: succinate dehydrogenase assembly factor 2 [Rhodobacteraceae bacterium]|nr:succinate dehydrogenase assembly factor 2 [Paracoccaceae bacterium]
MAATGGPPIRRLRMQARLRGTREACLLLGEFADQMDISTDGRVLEGFESLLSENDCDIVHWVLGTLDAPERHQFIVSLMASTRQTKDR